MSQSLPWASTVPSEKRALALPWLPASTLMRTGEYTVTEGFDELQQNAKDLLGF